MAYFKNSQVSIFAPGKEDLSYIYIYIILPKLPGFSHIFSPRMPIITAPGCLVYISGMEFPTQLRKRDHFINE